MPVDYRVDIKSSRICNGKVLTESISRQESMAMELSSPGGPEQEEKMWSKSFLWRRLHVKSTHMQAVAFKGFPVKKFSCFWQQPNGMWKGNRVCQTAGAGKCKAGLLSANALAVGFETGLSQESHKKTFSACPCKTKTAVLWHLSCRDPKAVHKQRALGYLIKFSLSWCCWWRGWWAVPDSGKADSLPGGRLRICWSI